LGIWFEPSPLPTLESFLPGFLISAGALLLLFLPDKDAGDFFVLWICGEEAEFPSRRFSDELGPAVVLDPQGTSASTSPFFPFYTDAAETRFLGAPEGGLLFSAGSSSFLPLPLLVERG